MRDKSREEIELQVSAQLEKRKKGLMRCSLPEDRSLFNALQTLTKAELDDVRYNLCAQGISSLNKQEMARSLAPVILNFSHRWFVTIIVEQYELLNAVAAGGGVCAELDEDDTRLDYMRSMGILFSGAQEGKLVWYMPDEVLAVYLKLNREKFAQAVRLNEETVRLTMGLLFYCGYLPYDQLYERVKGYLKEELDFVDFMGILINVGCWQGNIINASTGMFYYTLLDYEALEEKRLAHQELAFYPFAYEQVLQAGAADYIEETDAYKALVGFFMHACALPVLQAADIVGELQIILLNDEDFEAMLQYIRETVRLPDQEAAARLTELLTEFSATTRRWSLNGHCPRDLTPQGRRFVPPYAVQNAPNNVVQFVPRSALVGRNDPCPCGSGKKYKRCCLGKGI